MLRKGLTAIGLVEILSPEAVIDTIERIALENPDECELKSWVVPATRLEGIFYLFLMWRSDRSYAAFKKVLGVLGVLALLYPHVFVDYSAKIAYDDTSNCNWKPWIYPVTRLIGLVYIFIGLDELKK